MNTLQFHYLGTALVHLRNALQARPLIRAALRARPFAVALAHYFARCRPGRDEARLAMLNRLYTGSSPVDRLMCRAELRRCREAQRGERKAEVA